MGEKYNPVENTGIFTDTRDGKNYKTVTIGRQTVMAENMAYKVKEGCWALDNNDKNVAKYGYLYDWDTARKVAKGVKGWHLPSDKEWRMLVNYLGAGNDAYHKMKEQINSQIGGETNKSGFNALPVGFYSPVLPFGTFGKHANFWSRTRHGTENACKLIIDFKKGKAECSFEPWSYGFSVRLIKNHLFNHLFGNTYL